MRVYFLVGGGGGGKNPMYFICLQVDGPITEGGGERHISGSLRRYSNITRLLHWELEITWPRRWSSADSNEMFAITFKLNASVWDHIICQTAILIFSASKPFVIACLRVTKLNFNLPILTDMQSAIIVNIMKTPFTSVSSSQNFRNIILRTYM